MASPAIVLPRFSSESTVRDQKMGPIPVNSIPVETAVACMVEPTVNIPTAKIIDPFRPRRSATGPLRREPNQAAIR